MEQVTSTDLQRKLGQVISKAKREPVMVTSRGRPELVIVDASEYGRLKEIEEQKFQALQSAITKGLESSIDENFNMSEIQRALDNE